MKSLKKLLPLLFGLMILVQGAFAQPDPIQNLGGDWMQPQPKIQIWFTTNGDTARVATPTSESGQYWGVRFEDQGYVRCPDESMFRLSTLMHRPVENLSSKLGCIQDIHTNIDTLTSVNIEKNVPDTFVASNCFTEQYNAIDNTTVILEDGVRSEIVDSQEDAIFAYDSNGACVGYDNQTTVFAVGGKYPSYISFSDVGYVEGEPIKLAFYDQDIEEVKPLLYQADSKVNIPDEVITMGKYYHDMVIKISSISLAVK